MKQINFQIEEEILDELKKYCPDGEISKFIRDAIKEKLGIEKLEINSTYQVVKQMEKLNPESVIKKLIDLELLNQYLFEELKKQNELMKLIHRRSTLGSRLSSLIFDNVKDEQTRIREEKLAEIKIKEEVTNLNI